MKGTRTRVKGVKQVSSSYYTRPVFVKINKTKADKTKEELYALFGENVKVRALESDRKSACYITK